MHKVRAAERFTQLDKRGFAVFSISMLLDGFHHLAGALAAIRKCESTF